MPCNTVRDALHDSKECLFRGYNRHLQHSWKASLTRVPVSLLANPKTVTVTCVTPVELPDMMGVRMPLFKPW